MPLQVIDYGLIQTDFMNPKIGKIFSTRLLAVDSKEKFSPVSPSFCLETKVIF